MWFVAACNAVRKRISTKSEAMMATNKKKACPIQVRSEQLPQVDGFGYDEYELLLRMSIMTFFHCSRWWLILTLTDSHLSTHYIDTSTFFHLHIHSWIYVVAVIIIGIISLLMTLSFQDILSYSADFEDGNPMELLEPSPVYLVLFNWRSPLLIFTLSSASSIAVKWCEAIYERANPWSFNPVLCSQTSKSPWRLVGCFKACSHWKLYQTLELPILYVPLVRTPTSLIPSHRQTEKQTDLYLLRNSHVSATL